MSSDLTLTILNSLPFMENKFPRDVPNLQYIYTILSAYNHLDLHVYHAVCWFVNLSQS